MTRIGAESVLKTWWFS